MLYTDVKELTYNARSIRAFDGSRPAGEEMLKDLVDHARLCPSAANLLPLKYRLCFEKSEADAMFPLTRWAGYIKDRRIPPEGDEPTDYVIICHDTDVSPISEFSSMDVGIAAQTINLAAREKGYGCCMIGSFDKKAAKELLRIPENLTPVLVLAIGITYTGSIQIGIVSLSGLAVASITGIVLNAVLPGKDYEFAQESEGSTSVNFQV